MMITTLLLALALGQSGKDDVLWVEGEAAKTRQVAPPHSWYNSIKKDLLSGGDWVSNFSDKDGLVGYEVQVPKAGTYALWVRANPIGAALAWKIGAKSISPVPGTRCSWTPRRASSTWTLRSEEANSAR